MAQKVHACIVLDRSGSMEDCRTDAIGAVNSYLRQMKEDKDQEGRVSLVIFDSESIDTIRDRAPAASCAELSASEYQPRASTPLLDAVGKGVALLDATSQKDERRVLAVMTDGLENASREYTKASLKALLDRKQKEEGWLVLYLGAGHDAWAQAQQLGVLAGNTSGFSKDAMFAASAALFSRQKRYVKSSDHVAESAHGGFSPAERASMDENRSGDRDT